MVSRSLLHSVYRLAGLPGAAFPRRADRDRARSYFGRPAALRRVVSPCGVPIPEEIVRAAIAALDSPPRLRRSPEPEGWIEKGGIA